MRGLKFQRVDAVAGTLRRTPHGVRGLKFRPPGQHQDTDRSHPSRGAWIEIQRLRELGELGARRTPHGVRGLKFERVERGQERGVVAPLTGCVD